MNTVFLSRASWFDEERLVGYSRILCVLYVVIALVWIALSTGLIDPNGKPVGTDFMNVWAAGKLALAGDPAGAYDYAQHYEVQRHALPYADDNHAPYFGWHYPPMFLFAATLLAALPYGVALAAWMALTLPAYLTVVRRIVPYRHGILVAMAFPAAFVNVAHGQNGFLTTGLLGGGLLLLDRKPLLAGVLFGLMSYKPQFGILLPIVLAVGWQWRAFLSAAATTLAIALASYLAFGLETWNAFFDSLRLTRGFILEQGATGWEKIQSVFSAVRMLGGSIDAAYAAQALILIVAVIATIFVWRRASGIAMKGAALATASVLATPYVLDYDLILLALPIAWIAADARVTGYLAWEKTILLAAFALPLCSRTIGGFGVPIAPVILLLLLALIVRRTMAQPGSLQQAG